MKNLFKQALREEKRGLPKMEITDFVEKKCNSGKNILFKPKAFLKIDLEKTVSLLEKEKAVIEIETPSLLIFRLDGLQIDLNSNGKTIVKTEDRDKAEKAFSKLLALFPKKKP